MLCQLHTVHIALQCPLIVLLGFLCNPGSAPDDSPAACCESNRSMCKAKCASLIPQSCCRAGIRCSLLQRHLRPDVQDTMQGHSEVVPGCSQRIEIPSDRGNESCY